MVLAEKDHASAVFLEEFIREQVEEEAAAAGIAARLRTVGDAPAGLLMMDRALGERK